MKNKKAIRAAFRRKTFERDGFVCQCCGFVSSPERADEELDPHHITDRHEMPNGGYCSENGITVCKHCHRLCEQFHETGESVPGYAPEDLYEKIGSSLEKAVRASERLV